MKIWLAPMHGYTGFIFRNAYSEFFNGVDIAISPFISLVPGEVVGENRIRDLLLENNNSKMEVIPQILGNDPTQFLILINCLENLGYNRFNWNCGCPSKVVVKKRRGSGILPYPSIMRSTLEKVLAGTKSKISVKLRLGYESASEMFEIIKVLNDFDLESVILHPRMGKQLYDGFADVGKFNEFAEICRHNVIYNGDIVNMDDFNRIKSQIKNIDNLMIGRGILSNLFLPEIIKFGNEPLVQKFEHFYINFVEAYRCRIKAGNLIGVIKQYWAYFKNMFDVDNFVLNNLFRAASLNDTIYWSMYIIRNCEFKIK